MKKSIGILIVFFISLGVYFFSDGIKQNILQIQLMILYIGYMIVKQLEENKNE